jgi:hypothetical protein
VGGARFGFVQLELAGRSGLDDGRYPLRERAEAHPAGVLIVQTDGPPDAAHGTRRRRRRRVRAAERGAGAPAVPVTRLTAIRAAPFASAEEARGWLRKIGREADLREAEVAAAIALANRALHARSVAAADAAGLQLGRSSPLAVRIGYGTGDEVAAGRWSEAIDVPPDRRRVRRVDALRPTERVAALLGARERPLACETLILRARADLDGGRDREAALELRGGVEAMLAELGEAPSAEQRPDLEQLAERRPAVVAVAETAIAADPSGDDRAALEEALAIAERVLRRRRILG